MYFYVGNLILLYGKYFKNKLNNKILSWDYLQQMFEKFPSTNHFSYVRQGQDKVFDEKFGFQVEKKCKFDKLYLISLYYWVLNDWLVE